ncbi:MAG: hypothetical protein ACJ763_07555 [Bdellovibrionia bacterium]
MRNHPILDNPFAKVPPFIPLLNARACRSHSFCKKAAWEGRSLMGTSNFRHLLLIFFLALVAFRGRAHVDDKVTAKLYGFVKFDAAYDTAQVSPGDYYRIAVSDAQNVAGSNQFNATANQTRIGIDLGGPDTIGAKLSGKVEIDFYDDNNYLSSTTSPTNAWDNKPLPQLRLAYASLHWEASDFEISAGQNWDVISPLLTTTLNYYAGWNAGDLGYRRPQLRFTKGIRLQHDRKIITQLAFGKTVGSDGVSPASANLNNGNDMNYPQVQSRIAIQSKLWQDAPAIVGIYGHYGMEKYYLSGNLSDTARVPTWSAGTDITLPILDNLVLTGEFVRGADLRMFAGGISNGAAVINGHAIGVHATDFWTQLAYKPNPRLQLTAGGGQSRCDAADLSTATAPRRNSFVFGNAVYAFTKPLTAGIEVTQLNTDYIAQPGGRATRLQTSIQYTF